jgi:hypothetical protein
VTCPFHHQVDVHGDKHFVLNYQDAATGHDAALQTP